MINLTIIQLLNFNFFLGNNNQKWNMNSFKFILGIRFNFCIFDFSLIILTIRKVLLILTDILLKKGDVFFIGTSAGLHIFASLGLFKLFNYPYNFFFKGGCLSNFKELKKKMYVSKFFWKPPGIFFLFEIMNKSPVIFESVYSKIPLVTITDSNINNYKGTYTLLGNSRSFLSFYFFLQLIMLLIFLIDKRLNLSFLPFFFKKKIKKSYMYFKLKQKFDLINFKTLNFFKKLYFQFYKKIRYKYNILLQSKVNKFNLSYKYKKKKK